MVNAERNVAFSVIFFLQFLFISSLSGSSFIFPSAFVLLRCVSVLRPELTPTVCQASAC